MSRLRLKLASAAAFLLAWGQLSALEPREETGVFQIDPPTPYIHSMPADTPRGQVLVVHGLDVSKETMRLISAALADGGFEVYNIDLPGHGGSAAGFEAGRAGQAILGVLGQIGKDTIALGHSLGAGLLLDLAENHRFSTLVLLSPPPLPIARIQAGRTLIATGEEDLPRIRKFMPIAADIGGPSVETWSLPWAAHSAPIFNPVYVRRVVEWLGGNGGQTKTLARIALISVMFASAVVFGISLMPARQVTVLPVRIPETLVRYVVACSAALFVLKFVNPFSWLRLFATDYLIAFLFVTGLCLIGMAAKFPSSQRRGGCAEGADGVVSPAAPYRNGLSLDGAATPPLRGGEFGLRAVPVLKAVAAAAFIIVVLGWVASSHVLHTTLSNGRWWRFPFIVLAGLPLFIFDEITIRRIHPRWKSIGVALITRALFWAFLMLGVLVLNRQNAFLVLIVPLIVLFWIGLWLAAGIVHKHTDDSLASALFAALVQGWAFAAWFVPI